MPEREPDQLMPEIAANGDGPPSQVEALERELRHVHQRLDGVLCAVESLLQSPKLEPYVAGLLRDALMPATDAISGGASRLRSRLEPGVAPTGTAW